MKQITKHPIRSQPIDVEAHGHTQLAVGLLILGVGAAVAALLGPLVAGMIRYHVSEAAVNQIIGGDVAALILVAPMSIFAGFLVWRRHRAGPVLALGPSFYALYMYSQLALGGDVARYEGNSEQFFPLYLGLFVFAGAIAIRSWSLIETRPMPETEPVDHRSVGIFFLVVLRSCQNLCGPSSEPAFASPAARSASPLPTPSRARADPAIGWLRAHFGCGRASIRSPHRSCATGSSSNLLSTPRGRVLASGSGH